MTSRLAVPALSFGTRLAFKRDFTPAGSARGLCFTPSIRQRVPVPPCRCALLSHCWQEAELTLEPWVGGRRGC